MSMLVTESVRDVPAKVGRAREVIDEETTAPSEVARRSVGWCVYFRVNRRRLIRIPWECGAELTAEERAVLIPSIQEFQLGESSDGGNLKRLARQYAAETGDLAYPQAMNLFIAEEHRHSRYLGRFLDLAGAPRLESSWTDSVFRRLRRALGLELMLSALLTAELIAKVYYRALYSASSSLLLRRICAQLLRDERKHVEFQVERLRMIRGRRSAWKRALSSFGQRVLFAATCLAIWKRHGAAMRRGGYGFRRFWCGAWAEFEKAFGPYQPTAAPVEC
jgi:hypothetical protein